MDSNDFLRTEYAQYLRRDAGRIASELEQFNDKWPKFWERNADHLGVVLISHLIIEHYLNDWIASAAPGIDIIGKSRLSFAQKVTFLEGVDSSVRWVLPGIRRLNRIRNQLVHNLDSEISESELALIRDIVWPWNDAFQKPCNNGVKLIREFALLASGVLYSEANAIRRYGEGYGLVVYQRWLKAAVNNKVDN
ncbi:MAG TPA: hypothetical protein VFK12_04565 [Gammaproteobacteria bacterium]|nr:hypothetical protein [Gammaproteobacteria bacterium]